MCGVMQNGKIEIDRIQIMILINIALQNTAAKERLIIHDLPEGR
jgi:hypothetical protein